MRLKERLWFRLLGPRCSPHQLAKTETVENKSIIQWPQIANVSPFIVSAICLHIYRPLKATLLKLHEALPSPLHPPLCQQTNLCHILNQSQNVTRLSSTVAPIMMMMDVNVDGDDDKNTLKICPSRALPPICHRILPALKSRHPVSEAVTIPKNLPQLLLASSKTLLIQNCGFDLNWSHDMIFFSGAPFSLLRTIYGGNSQQLLYATRDEFDWKIGGKWQ